MRSSLSSRTGKAYGSWQRMRPRCVVSCRAPVLVGVQKIIAKVTQGICSEIVKNLQKFIPDHS